MSESSNLPRLVRSDGQEIALIGQLTIGRSSECSLHIEDDRASRQHARVEVVGQRVMLSDLDSRNGTWLNDQKITAPAELHDDDRIRIGRTIFTFKAAIAPPPDESVQPPVIPGESGKTMSWLTAEPMTLVRGNDGAEFGLNRSMRIGRDETNELVLKADTSASQFHARIELLEGKVTISDLNSHNGTWVNGKRITAPTVLKHGDKIRVGDTVFRLRVGDRSLPPLDVAAQPARARKLGCGLLSAGGFAFMVVLIVGLLIAWPSIRNIFITPTTSPASNTAGGDVEVTQTAVVDVEATQTAVREEALRALVLVIVPAYAGDIRNWDEVSGSSGSGSLLNEKGIVLTNFHVIGDTKTGKYYNPDGFIAIGLNRTNPQGSPDETYRCEVLEKDPELDLAVLRVVEFFDPDTKTFVPLPGNLRFTPVPIGDSSDLKRDEKIYVIGFPGAGDDTPTSTTGIVAGFLFLPDGNTPEWIKTDAETNPGNSGGMAINQNGELIGIPTLLNSAIAQDPDTGSEQIIGKISFIRPINLAADIIKSACPECLP